MTESLLQHRLQLDPHLFKPGLMRRMIHKVPQLVWIGAPSISIWVVRRWQNFCLESLRQLKSLSSSSSKESLHHPSSRPTRLLASFHYFYEKTGALLLGACDHENIPLDENPFVIVVMKKDPSFHLSLSVQNQNIVHTIHLLIPQIMNGSRL